MIRAHSIPIVGCVLSIACQQRPDGTTAGDGSTTAIEGGTLGGTETGVIVTTGAVVTTGATTGDVLPPCSTAHRELGTTSTGTASEGDSETSTGAGTGGSSSTGEACNGLIGDASQIPRTPSECGPEPCCPGEICVERIRCILLPTICDSYDYCYIDQDPNYCVPIPEECEDDALGLEDCLEQWNGICEYGGDYEDRFLDCDYVFDQCEEGVPQHVYCHDVRKP